MQTKRDTSVRLYVREVNAGHRAREEEASVHKLNHMLKNTASANSGETISV